MSVSYSVFIKHNEPLESVIAAVEAILNCRLKHSNRGETDYYAAEVMGVGVSLLSNVSYEDDGEIEFSKYNLQVMIEYHGQFDKSFANDFQRSTSIVLANMISCRLSCECIAVENMGTILASFDSQDR